MRVSYSARWVVALLICVAALWVLHKGLPWDQIISNHYFNSPCTAQDSRACWFFNKSNERETFYLHTLPNRIVTYFGVAMLALFAASFHIPRLRHMRAPAGAIVAGLICTPLIIDLFKHYSGHYCPGQLAYYQGVLAEVKNAYKPSPRCFPASHPAAWFSFVVLAFLPIPIAWRIIGLVAGIGLGSLFTWIQIARGEHFLSHALATLVIALFVGYSLRLSMSRWQKHKQGKKNG